MASFIASYVPGAPAPALPTAVGGFGGFGVAATAPARQPARLTPRVAAPPPEPEPERQPRHQSGMRRGFFGAAPPTATAVPVARSAGAPAVRAVPIAREPQPAPAPRPPAAGGGGFFGGAARQPEPSRQTSSPRGAGGGGSGGGRGQDHAAAMAALAEEDEEMKNSLEAVNLLSKARDLQRRNQAAGVGDEQGIDEVVTEMYERIMDLGGLAFGGSIPAAVLQKAGASEDDLTKVPTVVLTEAMIAEQCKQSGQDEVECILCYDVLRAGDKVARLSCGHFFHHSPPVPKRAELPDTLEIRGHACAITQFKALRYRAGAWECGVCERPQPTRKDLWMYHEGPIGTADDTGYDCCIRCTMRGGWIQAKVGASRMRPFAAAVQESPRMGVQTEGARCLAEHTGDGELRGRRHRCAMLPFPFRVSTCRWRAVVDLVACGCAEAWLDKTGSCPTCREEYKPPAPEPAMQGARPNEVRGAAFSPNETRHPGRRCAGSQMGVWARPT